MNKSRKILILGTIMAVVLTIILIFAVDWRDLKIKKEIRQTVQQQEIIKTKATEALRSLVDVANELSGITSGAEFNFELVATNGRSGKFGISKTDGVRSEDIVEEHMVIFRQVATDELFPKSYSSEVDIATNRVISMHRTPVDFGGVKPADDLETIARQFVERVYPDFARIESTFEFSSSGKGETNLFFRWDDKRFALPKGLEMDLNPFIQVGITSSGIIFSYDNTVPLYLNLSREALRAICAFVEMPRTDDSQLHPEKGIVKVWFTENDQFQNRYLVLPYEPETDFEGCSESAKDWLRHLPKPPA